MEYIRILKDLLAMDTSVPPGRNYEKAVDYLEPLFQRAGCRTEKVFIPKESAGGENDRVNLIIHRRHPGKHRVIFYAHIDVVPVKGWDGFEPRVQNGKIYGRGASDMKSQIVSLLMALDNLKNKPLDYDVSGIITVDEETGHAGEDELRFIRPYVEPVDEADFFSLDAGAGYVQVAALGVYAAEVTVHGRSVHQGRAYLGENAVENAIKLCLELMKLKEKIENRKSRIPAAPGIGVQYLQPNLTISMIHGGLKVNIVPDECVISLARRIIPEEDPGIVEKEINDTLKAVPGVHWEIKRILSIEPFPSTYNEPEVEKLASIIGEVTGRTGRYGMMGSLPLTTVGRDWKAKIFGVGNSGPEQNPHGIDEFAYLKDIENLAEIIKRFLSSQ